MTGLFRPKNPVLGVDFAGEVAEVGTGVTRFRKGDRVFGFAGKGGHAEYLAISEGDAVAKTPADLSDAEAAALPFGALSALVFLRDFGKVRPGHRVLVVGASGGVGGYAVQIAKALGAEVTGVASGDNAAFVESLGATDVIDYRTQAIAATGRKWDVILDTVRPADFAEARGVLAPAGVYLPLNFGLKDMLRAPSTGKRGGPRMITAINGDTREDIEKIAEMVTQGVLKPLIDSRFPMERIADAYRHVEGRHRKGAVILDVAPRPVSVAAA